jgi:hypothetical protein
MNNNYILYKNPIQLDTLYIVQYLYYLGYIFIPKFCIEENFPQWVTELPSIEYKNRKYIGYNRVMQFYEEQSRVKNLLYKALQNFVKIN